MESMSSLCSQAIATCQDFYDCSVVSAARDSEDREDGLTGESTSVPTGMLLVQKMESNARDDLAQRRRPYHENRATRWATPQVFISHRDRRMILTESMPLLPAIDTDMIIVDKDFDADERVIQALPQAARSCHFISIQQNNLTRIR